MWSAVLGVARGIGWSGLKWGVIVLAVVLLLLGLRRAGEKAGRLAERMQATEKANEVQQRMLEAEGSRPRTRGELADKLRGGTF